MTTARHYSPIILTNTRLCRRPSRLPGQPFRLALKDPLPGAEIKAAIRHRNHRCASRSALGARPYHSRPCDYATGL
jgi:hypothetical protein